MDPLFESLVHRCCSNNRYGYENEDDEDFSPTNIQDLKELINEIKTKALPIPNSNEILNYVNSHPRFAGWNNRVQIGTLNLLYHSMIIIRQS
jgi:hypothetical protein